MGTSVNAVIKASDLRIGNKLLFNEHMVDVFMMDAENIYEYYSSTCTDDVIAIRDCEGIPLTREILDKYGYVKEGYNAYRKKGSALEFSFSGNEVVCAIGCSRCRTGVPVASIEYLHQLQNLVYLLTGTEPEMIL
jgi:hypothetical protein